jgi:hypothetical protein
MKTLRNTSIITLAIVALALLMAPMAYADSANYTAILTAGPTSNSETFTANQSATTQPTELSDTFVFPQFDTSLGTLTGVEIILSGGGSTTITGTSSTGAVLSQLYTNSYFTLTGSGQTLHLFLVGGPPNSGSPLYDLNTNITIPNPGSYNGTFDMTGGPTDSGLITSGLGAFIGGSTIDFDLGTLTQLTTTFSTGGATLSQATNEYGVVAVTYDYESGGPVVPEPGTLSLFGTGLLGLAGMLRHRFMKSR